MSYRIKKLIYSLCAAAILAAAAGAFCFFTAPPRKNAGATVRFTQIAESDKPVNTEVSRSVSALRRTVTSEWLLAEAGAGSGLSAEQMKKIVSVERVQGESCAMIILSDMKEPAEAPILLINILHLAGISEDVPPFEVVTSCEMYNEPAPPYAIVSACGGLAGGLLCFLIMSTGRRSREYYRTEKADDSEDYTAALSMQEYIEDACKSALPLGALPVTAPEGLEKSGYAEAAESILIRCKGDKAKIIAVAPDYRRQGTPEDIAPDAKITAYLACAFAKRRLRTAVIECALKYPAMGTLFKTPGKGGLSAIAGGSCTIWDALVINARDGVDVISESKSYPAPTAVFASQTFSRLIGYLGAQYDVILLHAPKAWDCEEWELIYRECTGAVVICRENGMISANTAKGILAAKNRFSAICTIAPEEEKPKTKEKGKT